MVMPSSFSPADEGELRRRWRNGERRIARLAREMRKSYSSIRYHLVKLGLRPPSPSDLTRMKSERETVTRRCLMCRRNFRTEKHLFVCALCKETSMWR